MRLRLAFALAAFLLLSTDAFSQGLITPSRQARTQKNEQGKPIDAASRSSAEKSPLPSALPVARINIKARIEGQVATVTVEHHFRNDTDEQLEGTYYFPVPEGATLLEFAIYDGDQRRVGRVKDKEEARAEYDAAVSQGEDPAILEMTRRGWFQSRVYPIPARSEKRVEIIYSQVLPDKNGVVSFDYPLGRGYKKLKVPVDRVDIEVSLSSAVAITNVFSPTHPLEIEMDGDRRASCKITTMGGGDAENFQLVYTLSDEEINATLITYRREGEDGYFLLMLSPKVEFKKERISAKNTIFVVDVSGSMNGDKLSQAKEALRFGITRTLNENDRFNIIAFSSGITSMSPQLLDVSPLNIARARDFIDSLKADGATNINDSLIAAMQMFEAGARAQNLVFITDGHPTESVRYTDQIAANVRNANKTRVRLFTFGVGVDLNRLLLEKLAAENRGASLDITDYSQLARTLSTFFSKVSQPVLSDLQVDFGPVIVTRSHPQQLPDLYTRTQIKIFGRYSNLQELDGVTIALGGRMNEELQRFEFGGLRFPLVTDDKGYLPKLWATERVNALLAEIRLNGETPELKQEVVELARGFNLVTPYTSMYVPTGADVIREKEKDAAPATAANAINRVADGSAETVLIVGAGSVQAQPQQRHPYSLSTLQKDVGQKAARDAIGKDDTITVVESGRHTVDGAAVSITETVEIFAGQAAINTSSQTLSHTVDSRTIKDLPLLSGVEGLARLSSGVSLSAPGPPADLPFFPERERAGFSINGGRPRSTFFSIDASNNNDIDGQAAVSINNFDSIDTLQVFEFRGQSEPWASGASSIALTVRAGTNEYHGTIFDYHLNRGLGALSPLERRSGLARAPRFRSDTFGGTFGGPVLRDRLFFFGAFSRETEQSLRFSDSTSTMLTPTNEGLRALGASFDSPTVADLIRRGPLARAAGDPRITRRFLLPVLGIPVEFGEVVRLTPSTGEGYEGGGRLDYNPTMRDRLRAGYWYDSRAVTNSAGRQSAGYGGDVEGRAQLGYLRWERVFSPLTINEIGFSFNRARRSIEQNSPGGPSMMVGFRGLNYGDDPLLGAAHASTLYEINDRLVRVAGRHTFNLGGQIGIRETRLDYLPGREGSFHFLTFEDFVLNRPAASVFAAGSPRSRFSELHPSLYLNDVWKARPNLTLSLGLGYEIANQPVNQLLNRIVEREADPSRALFDATLPVETLAPRKVELDYNNLSPRIGFAYSPSIKLPIDIFGNEKSVIRAGVSLSYDQTAYRPIADVASSAPNILLGVLTPLNSDLSLFPDAAGIGALRQSLGGDPRAYARTIIDPGFSTPYSLAWHLDLTRNFDGRLTASAAYVGARGGRLIRAIDGNPSINGVTGGAGPLRVYETSGRSIYHALQARADLRITDHLTSGLAYSLSRLIDDVPESGAHLAGGPGSPASLVGPSLQSFAQNPFDGIRAERARSALDRKHHFAGHFVWDLPLRRGQSGILGRLLGGWKASGIIEISSGSPFTPLQYAGTPASAALFASIFSDRLGAFRPFAGNPSAPSGTIAFSNAANNLFRLFLNPDGTPFTSATGFIIADATGFRSGAFTQAQLVYNDFIVEQWARSRGLSLDAFGQTFASGRPYGSIGRNTFISPAISNIDFAMIKTTKLTEKVSLQFRSEFFNLFNHPNRGKPNSILENAGAFGFNSEGEVDAAPRRIRLALKLIF